jgi:hypothetical protein
VTSWFAQRRLGPERADPLEIFNVLRSPFRLGGRRSLARYPRTWLRAKNERDLPKPVISVRMGISPVRPSFNSPVICDDQNAPSKISIQLLAPTIEGHVSAQIAWAAVLIGHAHHPGCRSAFVMLGPAKCSGPCHLTTLPTSSTPSHNVFRMRSCRMGATTGRSVGRSHAVAATEAGGKRLLLIGCNRPAHRAGRELHA